MTDGVDPQILALLGGDKTSLLGGNAGKSHANVGDPDAFSRILDQQRSADANPAASPSDSGSSLPPGGRESAAGGDSAAPAGPLEKRGDSAAAEGSGGAVAAASANESTEQSGAGLDETGSETETAAGRSSAGAASDAARAGVAASPALGRAAVSIEGLPVAQSERSLATVDAAGLDKARASRRDAALEVRAAAVSERAKLRSPGLTAGPGAADDGTTGPQLASRGAASGSGPLAVTAEQNVTFPRTTGPLTSEAGTAKDGRTPPAQALISDTAAAKSALESADRQNARTGDARATSGAAPAPRSAEAAALAKLSSAEGDTAPVQQSASQEASAPKTPSDVAAIQSQLRRSQAASAGFGGTTAVDDGTPEDQALEAPRGVLLAREDVSTRPGQRPGSPDSAITGAPINPRAAGQPDAGALSPRGTEGRSETRAGIELAAGPAGEATAGGASRAVDAGVPTAPTATTGPAITNTSANAPAATSGAERMPEFSLSRAPEEPEFAGELTTRMKVLVRDGVREARINLHPAELGRLQVTVSTEGDQARISFMAETSAARDAIEQSLPRLRDMLEQNGLQLAQSDVGQQSLAQGRRDDSDEAGPVAAAGAGESDHEAQEGLDTPASVNGTSRIDTYI
ncbi:MAG: flagellar hook-length control protein FliK [Pseudomonadota bacterium]